MRYCLPTAATLAILLSACSPATEPDNHTATNGTQVNGSSAMPAPLPRPGGNVQNAITPPAPATPAPSRVIGLEGLGKLKIGAPVPAKSGWAERGAQTGDACRTISSPDYPGVYAIVTAGKVQRISVGEKSDVKLAEGVGAGDSERTVGKWFAGFRAEPHKYEDAPAKYLTAPNAGNGPALRFEIGQDGRVKFIHVGLMPALAYVEGCA